MKVTRLQKIISESDLLSRRKADLFRRQGSLTLNGLKEGKFLLRKNEWISYVK
tara:strand:+ start:1941 stop:2099 length:159 start_codon:yes stop_codon:yes gene_type:complete